MFAVTRVRLGSRLCTRKVNHCGQVNHRLVPGLSSKLYIWRRNYGLAPKTPIRHLISSFETISVGTVFLSMCKVLKKDIDTTPKLGVSKVNHSLVVWEAVVPLLN